MAAKFLRERVERWERIERVTLGNSPFRGWGGAEEPLQEVEKGREQEGSEF